MVLNEWQIGNGHLLCDIIIIILFIHHGYILTQMQKEALVAYSEFQKKYWESYWKNAAISEYRNETLRRQLTLLKKLERAVLSSDDLKRVHPS